ncbi:hypothetical protein QYM36_014404 [Artemia franciscana]|uniref:FDX-ACB domain-containing protein n=1 Tax=Artemia franciscana TaxID=6661 RepID=A0AA88KVL6_ARTSF|nr:hypothetical protein QYM36_014404 [Artemia franciscana]
MNVFKEVLTCSDKDKPFLIVGDGNFSFSRAVVENFGIKNIISSGFQSFDDLSDMAKENVNILKDEGITVLHGIDATALKKYEFPILSGIVFNFPHVGGKMKIQKNRELIQLFFTSAGSIQSSKDFKVCVSLCQGQGGIPEDTVYRTWENSWKIVEMAAYGGFILKEVKKFPKIDSYMETGYRSLEKRFHTEGSSVYIFVGGERASFPIYGNRDCFVRSILYNNLWTLNDSVVWQFMNHVFHIAQPKDLNFEFEELSYNPYEIYMCNSFSLHLQLRLDTNLKEPIVKHFVKLKRWNFDRIKAVFDNFGYQITEVFSDCDTHCSKHTLSTDNNIVGSACDQCCQIVVFIDAAILSLGKETDWRLLYHSRLVFKQNMMRIVTESLYPVAYTFDISFWDSHIPLSQKLFKSEALLFFANILKEVHLVDSYICIKTNKTSKCYRNVYQSLWYVLSKADIQNLHSNFGKLLEEKYFVKVR